MIDLSGKLVNADTKTGTKVSGLTGFHGMLISNNIHIERKRKTVNKLYVHTNNVMGMAIFTVANCSNQTQQSVS